MIDTPQPPLGDGTENKLPSRNTWRMVIFWRQYRLWILVFLLFWAVVYIAYQQTQTLPKFNASLDGRYQVLDIDLPDSIHFANEYLPLDDRDIYERLDRELTQNVFYQSNTLLLIRRSQKYFPLIAPILKQEGVPRDFRFVMAVESYFENRVSPRGAAGMWQLMAPTAKEFGLRVDEEVDERYHLQKSTVAACKLFKRMKNQFGNWTAALASYNMGNGALARSMRSQQSDSYYDLLLNYETSRYIFRVVALKEIMENPNTYGYPKRVNNAYTNEPVRKVMVRNSIPDLSKWAQKEKINLRILKLFNPWLRSNKLSVPAGQSYVIEIPKNPKLHASPEYLEKLAAELEGRTMEVDSSSFQNIDTAKIYSQDDLPSLEEEDGEKALTEAKAPAKRTIKIETATEPAKSKREGSYPVVPELKPIIHTIKQGDNLEKIAKRYSISVEQIQKLNPKLKKSSILKIGDELTVREGKK